MDTLYYRYRVVEDTAAIDTVRVYSPQATNGSEKNDRESLQLSGIKDFYFDTNNGFDQGLNLALTGKIEGMEIEGNLSDKAVPSQTVRIGDIEKMSIRVATENIQAGLGDLTLNLPFGIQDEIEGGRVGISTRGQGNNLNAAYAINRGFYRKIELNGEEGKQSPYFLEGKIVTGTEKVYLAQGFEQPILLVRDQDYHVNYEQSILSFTNRNIITRHSRITVEYTETTENYPKIYSETDAQLKAADFAVSTMYRRSRDDGSDPLNFTLTSAEIESLKTTGDSLIFSHTYYDTSSSGSYDLVSGHFVFMGEGNGHYNVIFFYVGENSGEYVYDPQLNGFSFQGPGLGNYSPSKFIPLPRNEQFYGVSVSSYKTVTATFYGSDLDQNIFSQINDNDNFAKGYKLDLRREFLFFSVDGNYTNFDRSLNLPMGKGEVGYNYDWNTADTLEELAKLNVGMQPFESFGLNFGYGVLNRIHRRKSVMVRPLFFYFGYDNVDTLDRLLAGLSKGWRNVSLTTHYEKAEDAHYANYGIKYFLSKQSNIGFSGEYDRNQRDRGITSKVEFASAPFSVTLGHRFYNDTTFLFATSSISVAYGGISFLGTIQQTQSYSQKKDEAFFKVKTGTGNYVYDSVTNTYIEKQNGDYIKKIILLNDFERITLRNYGLEASFSREFYDLRGRFDYLNESNFLSHNEEFQISVNGENADLEVDMSQRISSDSRYVLESNYRRERMITANPSYRYWHGHVERNERIEKEGSLLRESRKDYLGDVSWEILQQPLILPLIGYSYSYIQSGYFEALDIRLQAPKLGLTLAHPIKSSGRVELYGELIYRYYNLADIPFFFRATEPPGLTKIFSSNIGIGMGNNTVFNLIYSIQFPAGEKYNQNLKFQTRIRF